VETYPNECCGALYGKDGVVTATYPLPNTTEKGRAGVSWSAAGLS
jgi:hypothetical protein